jgi:endonuclease YncB( thermonuclease family)
VAPIEAPLGEFLLPKPETGTAGSLYFPAGRDASAFGKQNIAARLLKPNGTNRNIFIRVADSPFDNNNRLLAYIAPDYTERERQTIPRDQRTTFNLDLVASGWAAPFVIYPAIPGALDLPLLIDAAAARSAGLGIWADGNTLLAYEYRAMEKLHRITQKKVNNQRLDPGEEFSWRERYCVDMRTRTLHGPEDYFGIHPEYRP